MQAITFSATAVHSIAPSGEGTATNDSADRAWTLIGVALGALSGAVTGTLAIGVGLAVSASVVGKIVGIPLILAGVLAPLLGGFFVFVAAASSPPAMFD